MVLLIGIVCLAGWQVWLAWRLTAQDESLELANGRAGLERIADWWSAKLTGQLSAWSDTIKVLGASSGPLSSHIQPVNGHLVLGDSRSNVAETFPVGTTAIELTQNSVYVYPARTILFVPRPPLGGGWWSDSFDKADELEFHKGDNQGALAVLKPLAAARATRVEAMMRIARLERKTGNLTLALKTYERIEREQGSDRSGVPYALAAAVARSRMLIDLSRTAEALKQADAAREELLQGHWPISRETFEYYSSELTKLVGTASRPAQEDLAFSNLILLLYDEWQGAESGHSSPFGTEIQSGALTIWSGSPSRFIAIWCPPTWLAITMGRPPYVINAGVSWSLIQPGKVGASGVTVTRSLARSGLPYDLEFSFIHPPSDRASNRRALLIAGASLWPPFLMIFDPRSQRCERLPNCWLRTGSRTRLGGDRATCTSNGKLPGCTGWSKIFLILAAWNRAASNIRSPPTMLSKFSADPWTNSQSRQRRTGFKSYPSFPRRMVILRR